jgi:hypothetical protein
MLRSDWGPRQRFGAKDQDGNTVTLFWQQEFLTINHEDGPHRPAVGRISVRMADGQELLLVGIGRIVDPRTGRAFSYSPDAPNAPPMPEAE